MSGLCYFVKWSFFKSLFVYVCPSVRLCAWFVKCSSVIHGLLSLVNCYEFVRLFVLVLLVVFVYFVSSAVHSLCMYVVRPFYLSCFIYFVFVVLCVSLYM